MSTAIYRTRITHRRRAPMDYTFENRGYSWYVDLDDLPELPRWLRPFARFDATDHFDGCPESSLRQRIDAFLVQRGAGVPGGRITALLQARVLGYVFNSLSMFWCHDQDGVLRHVVAEVHNTYGGRHAYLLSPADRPVSVAKAFYVSPFNAVDGRYQIRAPRPDSDLDIMVSLHREDQPAFVVTMRGARRPASTAEIVRLQFISPLAPLMGAFWIRVHGIVLFLRGLHTVPRPDVSAGDGGCPHVIEDEGIKQR